jgi:small subunit ribosomal protein S2
MKVTLKELLEAGCHFGHQTVRWNPLMKPYIFTARDGVHIFDLAKTKQGLEEAGDFIKETVNKCGKVLFVGTKRQSRGPIIEVAKRVSMPYVSQRWLGGTITNWEQLKKSIDKLAEMKEKREKGEYKDLTKKEQLLIDRKIAKFEKFLGGVKELTEPPQAVFVVDAKRESAVVKEANRRKIPIIAMVDTDSSPTEVDFVIPVNDDAASSIELILGKIGEAVEEGKKIKKSVK